MTALASSHENRSDDRHGSGLAAKKARRGPVFPISRAEVVRRCREGGHDMLAAGVVLALMDLMTQHHYCIKRLHEDSGVSRSMIHDTLIMAKEPSTDIVGRLGKVFGMDAFEFYLLGHYTLLAEVSL
jgi:hypothetical protein